MPTEAHRRTLCARLQRHGVVVRDARSGAALPALLEADGGLDAPSVSTSRASQRQAAVG